MLTPDEVLERLASERVWYPHLDACELARELLAAREALRGIITMLGERGDGPVTGREVLDAIPWPEFVAKYGDRSGMEIVQDIAGPCLPEFEE